MRPLTNISKLNTFRQVSKSLLIILSITTLAACGSSNEDEGFIAPRNAEPLAIALTEDALPSGVTIDANANFYANEAYGSDERNVFDIFLPESGDATGLVIFVHGGGFYTGDKGSIYGNSGDINDVLDSGNAFATINYSLLNVPGLTPGVEMNDEEGVIKSLTDIKEALQYFRYNADNFNIDPAKIAMYGSSAGAVSSLWLAYSDDMAIEESEDPLAQQSSRLVAAGAIETQASLDMVRWEQILNLTLEDAAALSGGALMESMYGLPSDAANNFVNTLISMRAETGELAEFRASVDMPALIDANDPPVFVSNVYVSMAATQAAFVRLEAIPAEVAVAIAAENVAEVQALQGEAAAISVQLVGALLHFPTHALTIKAAGEEAGATVVSHIPEFGIMADQTVVPFLLERL